MRKGGFIILFLIGVFVLVGALETGDYTQGDFNNGTYNFTFYNSSGFIQLNSSRLNGTFTSQIFNAGSLAQWNNISWTQEVYSEPDELSGLVLWTKADSLVINDSSGNVSNWGDLSGNNNNFTQATVSKQPKWIANSINGQPGLRVNASFSQTMLSNTNFPAPVTVIYIGKHNGGSNLRMLTANNNNWLLGFWEGQHAKAYFNGWVSNTTSYLANTILSSSRHLIDLLNK